MGWKRNTNTTVLSDHFIQAGSAMLLLLLEECKLYVPALFLALSQNGPCTLTIKYWVKNIESITHTHEERQPLHTEGIQQRILYLHEFMMSCPLWKRSDLKSIERALVVFQILIVKKLFLNTLLYTFKKL